MFWALESEQLERRCFLEPHATDGAVPEASDTYQRKSASALLTDRQWAVHVLSCLSPSVLEQLSDEMQNADGEQCDHLLSCLCMDEATQELLRRDMEEQQHIASLSPSRQWHASQEHFFQKVGELRSYQRTTLQVAIAELKDARGTAVGVEGVSATEGLRQPESATGSVVNGAQTNEQGSEPMRQRETGRMTFASWAEKRQQSRLTFATWAQQQLAARAVE
eukprot:3365789-Amphidinium_carterae.2